MSDKLNRRVNLIAGPRGWDCAQSRREFIRLTERLIALYAWESGRDHVYPSDIDRALEFMEAAYNAARADHG